MKIIICYISEAWQIISSGFIEKDELFIAGCRYKSSISRQLKLLGLHHVMGYRTGRNISILFTEEKSLSTEKKCYCLSFSKSIYINLAQTFLFFLFVWSQSLKILVCVKIAIECWVFAYQIRHYLLHINWFVL